MRVPEVPSVRIGIVKPGPGQESVWDYPRPPVIQPTSRKLEAVFAGRTIAATSRGLRVLETSHPPVYYFPVEHVAPETLVPGARTSYCEFKGEARYFSVVVNESRADDAAWNLAVPAPGYEQLLGYVAFYPDKMDECRVDGEVVRPQPGRFYGGWITSDIVGPFKGEPGTNGW